MLCIEKLHRNSWETFNLFIEICLWRKDGGTNIVAESIYMLHYFLYRGSTSTIDQVPAASFKRNMFDSCWVERIWGKACWGYKLALFNKQTLNLVKRILYANFNVVPQIIFQTELIKLTNYTGCDGNIKLYALLSKCNKS